MRAAPLLPLLLVLLAAPAARAIRAQVVAVPQPQHPAPGSRPVNTTRTGAAAAAVTGGGGSSNSSGDALVTRISSLLRDLPTLKAAVIVACAFTAFLIACLLLRVFRWVPAPLSSPAGPPTGRDRDRDRVRATCAHRCSECGSAPPGRPVCSYPAPYASQVCLVTF